jgi:hypothetical protein
MTSSKRAARIAGVLGVLAVLANPAGVLAAQVLNGVSLLRSLYLSVPAAAVLGLLAISASRRARFAHARSLYADGQRAPRLGRFLAWVGVYAAVTGAVALGVYGALRAAS